MTPINFHRAAAAAAGAAIALTLAAPLTSSGAILTYDRETLPGGGVLLVKESHQLPIVTIEISFPAGARFEALDRQGLAQMTAGMLLRGTRKKSASAIEKLNDRLGGGVSASAGRDFATASLRVLTRDLEEGMEFLADVLRRPTFPPKELGKMKARTLGGIERKRTAPAIWPTRPSGSAFSGIIPTAAASRACPRRSKTSGGRTLGNSTASATE